MSATLRVGDDGECAAWDPRYRHVSWKTEVCPSGRGVTGLALLPCRARVAASCADGFVRVLELRMGRGLRGALNDAHWSALYV